MRVILSLFFQKRRDSVEKIKKYRGEIPYFIQENCKDILIYICSSYRNLEDYYPVLKDISSIPIYVLESKEEEESITQRYEVFEFFKNKKKAILLLTIDMFLKKYEEIGIYQRFQVGKEYSLSNIVNELEKYHYHRNYLLEKKGEYSVRGDILDIFPYTSSFPIRIEFFGEEVERISYFNIEDQKSFEILKEYKLYIDNNKSKENLLLFLGLDSKKYRIFFENIELLSYKVEEMTLLEEKEEIREYYRKEFEKLCITGMEVQLLQFHHQDLENFRKKEELEKIQKRKKIIIKSLEMEKYKEIYSDTVSLYQKYPYFEGYENESELVLTDRELKGIRVKRKGEKQKKLKISHPTQIQEGEYIIHENYGVGLYLGMEVIDEKEYLKIKYADEDKLFVPLEGIHKIEKYVHIPGVIPEIYHLGRKGFQRKRLKLQEEILEFAKEIIEIQAKRKSTQGFQYSPDTVWQEDFEESFPYTETTAQKKAIQDVKQDMESGRVMDRLICGDVGYGKTEIAIRATFKAIMDQKQVVILAPTTVLAEQHYHRFQERFLNYPIEIVVLSRMKTAKEQKQILERMKNGTVDLIIGTSRLLSNDIEFKDLGLLIIDEEQKFGVKAKEKFKKIRGNLNILAMTATPIPRTLNLSLLGIRDLSMVDVPPEGRKTVKTFFIEKKEDGIIKAILQELAREGQVFYIFNSVKKIEDKVKELEKMLPSYVKVDCIHGKMSGKELKYKIEQFENMQIDVLVSTTIIENGIDIENANTMIIEGMEKLGLSQIYQLRGRIGRGRRQSYCYCLISDYKSKKAEKREKSLMELGERSGLDLSMEDMKIRGAGEILGEKQHGLIETLGYNFYIKMLEEEISKLKGEKLIENENKISLSLNFPKYIPDFYIHKEEKIVIYKRALALQNMDEIIELEAEILDRFGKFPVEVEGFFQYLKIQFFCRNLGICELIQKNEEYWIRFEEEKVNIDKIIALFIQQKIDYIQKTKEVVFHGNLFQFFEIYQN